MAESDNILTKLQDLLVYLIPQLNKFPRDQKFVLGDRIETKLLDVQEDCLRAYYSRDKRGHLLEANLQLEVARHQETKRQAEPESNRKRWLTRLRSGLPDPSCDTGDHPTWRAGRPDGKAPGPRPCK